MDSLNVEDSERRSRNEPQSAASLAAAASRRADVLRERIEYLNVELGRLKSEMYSNRRNTSAYLRYRRRAKQVLRQKKTLEIRLVNAMNQSYNLTVIDDTQAAARAAAYEEQSRLFADFREELGLHPSSVDDLQEDLQNSMDETDEVSRILATPLDGVDDEELEAELENELQNISEARYPSVPSVSPDSTRVHDNTSLDSRKGAIYDPSGDILDALSLDETGTHTEAAPSSYSDLRYPQASDDQLD